MKIFLDSADPEEIARHAYDVDGFTTNPTLFKKAGVTDYLSYAKALCASTDKPVCIEVLADTRPEVERQAMLLAELGAVVKVPVSFSNGVPTYGVLSWLAAQGVSLNVTACTTLAHVSESCEAIGRGIVSLFCGRIADAGVDPTFLAERAARKCAGRVELLWASTREAYNAKQAEAAGCDVITVTPELLPKVQRILEPGLLPSLGDVSLETVKQFIADGEGYTL